MRGLALRLGKQPLVVIRLWAFAMGWMDAFTLPALANCVCMFRYWMPNVQRVSSHGHLTSASSYLSASSSAAGICAKIRRNILCG